MNNITEFTSRLYVTQSTYNESYFDIARGMLEELVEEYYATYDTNPTRDFQSFITHYVNEGITSINETEYLANEIKWYHDLLAIIEYNASLYEPTIKRYLAGRHLIKNQRKINIDKLVKTIYVPILTQDGKPRYTFQTIDKGGQWLTKIKDNHLSYEDLAVNYTNDTILYPDSEITRLGFSETENGALKIVVCAKNTQEQDDRPSVKLDTLFVKNDDYAAARHSTGHNRYWVNGKTEDEWKEFDYEIRNRLRRTQI